MSKFGSLAPSDKPFRVELLDDGKPIKDKNGNVAYIDVYSSDGMIGRKFDKDERASALDAARKGQTVDAFDPFERNIAKCAALTASWYLVDPDTQEPLDVPFSIENAKELYSLPLTTWIFVQPWGAANNHSNFIKRSAKSSSDMPSGTSETTAS